MNKTFFMTMGAVLIAASLGCQPLPKKTEAVNPGTSNQIGTAHALMIGAYQKQATVAELPQYGNFGIGVAENLNGELIMLDGELYQASVGDELQKPESSLGIPFMTMCHFESERTWPITKTITYADLEKLMDAQVVNPEHVSAIKISGTFDTVRYRCLSLTQNYVPYTDAVKQEHIYENDNVKGTLVGFFFPPFFGDINFKRYTFHFIQDDVRHGGHLIDCKLRTGKIEMMQLRDLYVKTGDVQPPLASPR